MKSNKLNRTKICIITLLILINITACNKEGKLNTKSTTLKGKIAPSLSMTKDGAVELYDLRNPQSPQKAAFNVVGDVNSLTLNFIKNRPIGSKTIKSNYGDLTINHNNEVYLADRNWPNWSNVSTVGSWLTMNNDSTNLLYPAYQDNEGNTKLYDYAEFFKDYKDKANWGNPGTINGVIQIYERGSDGYYRRNSFYLNFKTQEYLFQKDLNSSDYSPIYGYKITDLIKKPNGNMDTDPIDWTKADFAIPLAFNANDERFTYNGKKVILIIFIDLDTKTYVKVLRNLEDDIINGEDKGRQTLLTTSWQPLSNLIKGWDL